MSIRNTLQRVSSAQFIKNFKLYKISFSTIPRMIYVYFTSYIAVMLRKVITRDYIAVNMHRKVITFVVV